MKRKIQLATYVEGLAFHTKAEATFEECHGTEGGVYVEVMFSRLRFGLSAKQTAAMVAGAGVVVTVGERDYHIHLT